jgi:hypothetical protein
MGNTWKKNQEKKSAVCLAIFFGGLSFYGADCNCTIFSLLPACLLTIGETIP